MTDQRLALSTTQPASPAEADYDAIGVAAERLQDLAWTMRERGHDVATCAQVEELAAAILTASSLRDPADRRAQKLGVALQYLEQRIEMMLAGGGATAAKAPPPPDLVPQPAAAPAPEAAHDIMAEIENELFASVPVPAGSVPAIKPPAVPAARPTPHPPQGDPLAALHAMSDEERIALFT